MSTRIVQNDCNIVVVRYLFLHVISYSTDYQAEMWAWQPVREPVPGQGGGGAVEESPEGGEEGRSVRGVKQVL